MSRRFSILLAVLALANIGLLINAFLTASEVDSLFTINRMQQQELEEHARRIETYEDLLTDLYAKLRESGVAQ